jgi:hypothetical protein
VVRVHFPSELASYLTSLKNMTGLSESEILRHAFIQYLIRENIIENKALRRNPT